MPHGSHIYAKSYDTAKTTMCAYPQSDHSLPHWKCVMQCCAKCPIVNLPDQEIDYQYSNSSPSIRFSHFSYNFTLFNTWKASVKWQNNCRKCKQDYTSEESTNIYTRKELVMIKTAISNFHTSFYITSIQKLAFHIPHVQILGTSHYGDSRWTKFKRRDHCKIRVNCPIIEKNSKVFYNNSDFSYIFIQLYWWTTEILGGKSSITCLFLHSYVEIFLS